MEANRPSRTALGAALHRAAHQVLDVPPVFVDPLARRIVGEETDESLRYAGDEVPRTGLRAFIATRSRFTEDCLAEAYARGVRQYVLLGAGLDTFAYRSTAAFPDLQVFEVDYPATQGWKRERLAHAGIAIPPSVTYAPIDFEHETLTAGLAHAGFNTGAPAVFAWLGVTPYLTSEVAMGTLRTIAGLAPGTEVIFDYREPPENGSPQRQLAHAVLAAAVAATGEPFKSAFDPATLMADMKSLGFSLVEDLFTEVLNARYFVGRTDGLRLRGHGHLMHARV